MFSNASNKTVEMLYTSASIFQNEGSSVKMDGGIVFNKTVRTVRHFWICAKISLRALRFVFHIKSLPNKIRLVHYWTASAVLATRTLPAQIYAGPNKSRWPKSCSHSSLDIKSISMYEQLFR